MRRQVTVGDRKTKVDWAIEMAELLQGRYADCEKVIVVCDNLSTHAIGAIYEVFEPAGARAESLETRRVGEGNHQKTLTSSLTLRVTIHLRARA